MQTTEQSLSHMLTSGGHQPRSTNLMWFAGDMDAAIPELALFDYTAPFPEGDEDTLAVLSPGP